MSEPKYQCPDCDFSTDHGGGFASHIKTHEEPIEPPAPQVQTRTNELGDTVAVCPDCGGDLSRLGKSHEDQVRDWEVHDHTPAPDTFQCGHTEEQRQNLGYCRRDMCLDEAELAAQGL